MHVNHGFEFLGYKIKRGQPASDAGRRKIGSGVQAGALYAYPREKSIEHFKDQIRQLTRREGSSDDR